MDSPDPTERSQSTMPLPQSRKSEILHSLVSIASRTAGAQIDAFSMRLSEALAKQSESSIDPKQASLTFNAAALLKTNAYAFFLLASEQIEKRLQQEVDAAQRIVAAERARTDDALSLVPFEEMEQKLLINNLSRSIELENTDRLTALGMRVALLLGRDEITIARNPFRPEIFLDAIDAAWREFSPESETHPIVLPLLQPDVFLDLKAIYQELNDALILRSVLPDLVDAYRIKKTGTGQESGKPEKFSDSAVFQQLQRLFASNQAVADSGAANLPGHVLQATAVSNQLLGYLAGVQKNVFDHHQADASPADAAHFSMLANIKSQAPKGTLTSVDETTIDLLTKIFDVVFRDQNIPAEIKALIGFLQVPVLKAALIDKEFFFQEEHPARRLIELLTNSSMGWNQKQGQDDPLYQTIKQNVQRVQQDFDQQITVFSDVVSDLESFISKQEDASATALSEPITEALRQEKIGQAKKTAKTEVALRIGTGEVVAFVETFLESKWVTVLTLAYSVQDEKPQAVTSAIKTMDDLIWSVKPKITLEERKEFIAKLPSMLAMLNKWLNVVRLDDAERLQFFAELAECHASIVRAPLELSPQRQLEIATEVAQRAAERRQQKLAGLPSEPLPDELAESVQILQRGAWLEFQQGDGSFRKFKLAWVSPLRSLYIFSTGDRQESFSVSAEDLAQTFREDRARCLLTSGLVGRALTEALQTAGANDATMSPKSAA